MSLRYIFLGIPKNLDEFFNKLKETTDRRVNIEIKERECPVYKEIILHAPKFSMKLKDYRKKDLGLMFYTIAQEQVLEAKSLEDSLEVADELQIFYAKVLINNKPLEEARKRVEECAKIIEETKKHYRYG